ncbi:MAG: hypothetical protein QG583_329 [Patescibacteria group bacterium]|nr:hypothetical protein [Patescibacteria group bacterium]
MSKNKNLAVILGIVAVVVLVAVSLLSSANIRVINDSTKTFDVISNPTTEDEGIQAISIRKCRRLGGVYIPHGDYWAGELLLNNPGPAYCAIVSNAVANLPDYVPVRATTGDNPVNDPTLSISKKKCLRLGGEIVYFDDWIDKTKWVCIIRIDSDNTRPTPYSLDAYYDNTLGITEPITKETIAEEAADWKIFFQKYIVK